MLTLEISSFDIFRRLHISIKHIISVELSYQPHSIADKDISVTPVMSNQQNV